MIKKMLRTEKAKVSYYTCEMDPKRRTLFFLHGLTADHRLFKYQMEYFKDFYNVITWDAPGHGESKEALSLSMDSSSDIIKAILEEEGVSSVIFVGQSLGGYHAQSFILRNPGVTEAFIGIGTSPYGNYYSKLDFFLLKKAAAMVGGLNYESLKNQVAKGVSITEEGKDTMLKMLESYTHEEYALLLQESYAAFMEDNTELKLTMPVLLLLGEKDKTGKVVKYNKKWHKKTGAPLIILKGASHNANLDSPIETNRIIHEFLKEHHLT